jgi:hypothetical protein
MLAMSCVLERLSVETETTPVQPNTTTGGRNGSGARAIPTTTGTGDEEDRSVRRYLVRQSPWSFWRQGRRRCRMGLDLALEASNNRRDHVQTGRGKGKKEDGEG